ETPHDVEALLTFLGTAEGGRLGPVFSDWRPMLRYDGRLWIVRIDFPNTPSVNPGDKVLAFIDFLSPEAHFGKLSAGTFFDIIEGRKVAYGLITKLAGLEESARRARERAGMPSNNRWRGP